MITALVPTFNCQNTIRACLESVKWTDRILIVDSFSTDRTLEICREYTGWILQHEYVNSAAQKNWAMEKIDTEWTLQLDSDEQVEPALKDEIREVLVAPSDANGFRIRIKNLVWGKWVRSCNLYPCAQVRLFRTAKGRWSKREVHARLQGVEKIGDLQHHIIHADLEDISTELQQFSRQVVVWESNELIKRGRRWHWWDVTLRPAAIFLVLYLKQGGYRDGFRGFYLSVYRAVYGFMTYARLYESEVRRGLRS
jgi:glycosyltransferase involved in cell wall biosynthesis